MGCCERRARDAVDTGSKGLVMILRTSLSILGLTIRVVQCSCGIRRPRSSSTPALLAIQQAAARCRTGLQWATPIGCFQRKDDVAALKPKA
jgi:hypothetical protein